MEQPGQPTGLPTPEGTPVTPSTGVTQGVNPAQALSSPQSQAQPSSSTLDVSGMIATYEQRIRTLMSEKDKALHERNVAITAQTDLQKQLTDLQTQSSSAMGQAASAAQQAIDENKRLSARIGTLEGELLRARTLLEHPDLTPYAEFIPVTGDEAKQREAIEKLKAIREQDLARVRGTFPPQSTLPSQQSSGQGQPGGVPQQSPDLYGLYAGRPNVPPQFASNPAQMHPAGGESTITSIDKLLREARASGDSSRFEEALRQAQVLARTAVDTQLGRTTPAQ